MKNNKGFSLVELIVVIAIMAILAAVAVIGVSVYIPKAQKANDDELLNIMSDALTSACLSEGIDQRDIVAYVKVDENGQFEKTGEAINLYISSSLSDDQIAAITTVFNSVLSDKNAAFKTEAFLNKSIYYRNGKFDLSNGNGVYDGIVFDQADIDAIKDSNFDKLGASVLLDRIDLATDLLAGLAGEGDSSVDTLLMDPENLKAMAELMEWGTDQAVIDAKFEELVNKKVVLMTNQDPSLESMDDDELYAMAAREVLANNAVLIAATQPKYNQDEFVVAMANGTAKSVILANLGPNTSTAISQAALVYGMYTSYAALNNIPVTGDFDMQVVLDAMDTDGFKSYMATEAQKDLDAYNASMNMINTSTSNKEAVEDVLLNGFDSDALNNMMSDALN